MLHLRSIFLAANLVGFCALAAAGLLGVGILRVCESCRLPRRNAHH